MFPQKQRVPRKLIEEIFKNKTKNFSTVNFFVKKQENNLTFPRFAVIVSKKIDKSSVKRHTVKRKILNQIKKTNTTSAKDFVITPKNNLSGTKTTEIIEELGKILN